MNDNDNTNSEQSEGIEEPKKKSRLARPTRKTQSQVLQEALGIEPGDLKDVESKLTVIKFLDYVSEEPLDFAFKERAMDQYSKKIVEKIESIGAGGEEGKLLKKGFEDKKVLEVVNRIRTKTEEVAISKGINKSIEKRLRNLKLILTAPVIGVALLFILLPLVGIIVDQTFLILLLCVFCMVSQYVSGSASKKWVQFKENNRNELYTNNRDDILVLKSYVGEILANARSDLLELKVPLELIKFSLFHRDYADLNVIQQKQIRGVTEYFVSFKYPEGMDPIPIPANLQQQYNKPIVPDKKRDEKTEKNFIVLTEMKGKEGVITSFVPSLKDNLADKINKMLRDSKFSESDLEFKTIIPNYSPDLAIYCICGEIASIETINVCNWKKKFKFYLFEGKVCKCGDQIYAISLMDEKDEIPEELQDVFLI